MDRWLFIMLHRNSRLVTVHLVWMLTRLWESNFCWLVRKIRQLIFLKSCGLISNYLSKSYDCLSIDWISLSTYMVAILVASSKRSSRFQKAILQNYSLRLSKNLKFPGERSILFQFEQGSNWFFLVVQMAKNLPATWETWVQSLGQDDLLEKRMATHSSILAWRIP